MFFKSGAAIFGSDLNFSCVNKRLDMVGQRNAKILSPIHGFFYHDGLNPRLELVVLALQPRSITAMPSP